MLEPVIKRMLDLVLGKMLEPIALIPDLTIDRIIRKIFYPDLTTLGCSDPQIRQIACQIPLSALILAGSPQIHQITLDILDQLE